MSNTVVFVTAMMVSTVVPVNAGLAGLAITSAINLTDNLSWFVRMVRATTGFKHGLPLNCISTFCPAAECYGQALLIQSVSVVAFAGQHQLHQGSPLSHSAVAQASLLLVQPVPLHHVISQCQAFSVRWP